MIKTIEVTYEQFEDAVSSTPRWVYELPSNPSPCLRKLSKFDWQFGISFESCGVAIGLRSNQKLILERIAKSYLPPYSLLSESPTIQELYSVYIPNIESNSNLKRYCLAFRGSWRFSRSLDLENTLMSLGTDLQYSVAYISPTFLFFDAGVVVKNGNAVLITGDSGDNRTALIEELIASGATCYSDQYAMLDRDGYVYPYSCKYRNLPFESVCKTKVKMIVQTEFCKKAKWNPVILSNHEKAMLLFSHAIAPQKDAEVFLLVSCKIASEAIGQKSRRGDARLVVDSLLSVLES
jgi:hypothetical protein